MNPSAQAGLLFGVGPLDAPALVALSPRRRATVGTDRPLRIAALLWLACGSVSPAAAQTLVTVEGRVYASDTGSGIVNAIVTLEGYGSVLTSASGAFRFDQVDPGARGLEAALEVVAFGYAEASVTVSLNADVTVDVPLTPEPIALDSLTVDLETLDFDGLVRDPERDLRIVDADVLSSQGHAERTNSHGQFDLDDVYEGVPLRIAVRSFGYLPLDTVLVPDDERRHEFDLRVDSAAQRVIDMQVERIIEVTRGRRSVRRPMDRERLLRYAGAHTVYDMLLAEYGYRLQRVGCIVVDEEQILASRGWRSYLSTMLPEELERVEFLFGGGMLRIYTRAFIQRMSVARVELREPMMFPRPRVDALCG